MAGDHDSYRPAVFSGFHGRAYDFACFPGQVRLVEIEENHELARGDYDRCRGRWRRWFNVRRRYIGWRRGRRGRSRDYGLRLLDPINSLEIGRFGIWRRADIEIEPKAGIAEPIGGGGCYAHRR